MTQVERDRYRLAFLVSCYRRFGTGQATDNDSFVMCGRALAAEGGLDPASAREAFLYWSRRKCISPTMQGGGYITSKGQDVAEEALRHIEEAKAASRPPDPDGTANNQEQQVVALRMIDSALASLEAIASGLSSEGGPDRITRWWEHVALRLRDSVSARESNRFWNAYSDVVPGLLLGGDTGVRGAAIRGRTYLLGLRADIDRSPSMLTPAIPPRAEPPEASADQPMHPAIEQAAGALLQDGHYAQAVFEASKALVSAVKARAGRPDLDGATLMRTAFSPKAPILAFNRLVDQSDRDEHEGMMHLYEGAVLAVRNPRARSSVEDSPESARRYLDLLNFLAHRLDEATMPVTSVSTVAPERERTVRASVGPRLRLIFGMDRPSCTHRWTVDGEVAKDSAPTTPTPLNTLFRVGVVNEGSGTVEGARAILESIKPSPPGFLGADHSLTFMDSGAGTERIHPGDTRWIDLVGVMPADEGPRLVFYFERAGLRVGYSAIECLLTLRVVGEGVSPARGHYRLSFDAGGQATMAEVSGD